MVQDLADQKIHMHTYKYLKNINSKKIDITVNISNVFLVFTFILKKSKRIARDGKSSWFGVKMVQRWCGKIFLFLVLLRLFICEMKALWAMLWMLCE